MIFFEIKTTWSNAELIALKACIASAYILVGSYFHNFFSKYYVAVLVVFGITLIWVLYLWINKMKI
jgi:hypothetical protein